MTTSRRTITLAALVAGILVAWSGCPSSGQRGSGTSKRELRQVGAFSSISVGGAFKLEITVGAAKPQVAVTADDNLLQLIRTEVKDGQLVVGSKRSISPRLSPRLEVKVPRLEALSISGAAHGEVHGIGGERFKLEVSGAGKVTLAGETKDLLIEVSGAAAVDAAKLTATTVKVEGSGAISVTVRAADSLTAIVSGAGRVAYFGDPKQVKRSLSGVAKLVRIGP